MTHPRPKTKPKSPPPGARSAKRPPPPPGAGRKPASGAKKPPPPRAGRKPPPRPAAAASGGGASLATRLLVGIGLGTLTTVVVGATVVAGFMLANRGAGPKPHQDPPIAKAETPTTPKAEPIESKVPDTELVTDVKPVPVPSSRTAAVDNLGSKSAQQQGEAQNGQFSQSGGKSEPSGKEEPIAKLGSKRKPVTPPGPSTSPPPAKGQTGDPFADIRARNRMLPLPPAGPDAHRLGAVELCRLPVPSSADCSMELAGGDMVLDGGRCFQLEPQTPSDDTRAWDVLIAASTSLGEGKRIGQFILADSSLKFAWDPSSARMASADRLRCGLLRLDVEGDKESCRLIEPEKMPPLAIDSRKSNGTWEIDKDAASFPPMEHVRMRLVPESFPDCQLDGDIMEPGGTVQIRILDAAGSDSLLDIQISWRNTDPIVLRWDMVGYPQKMVDGLPVTQKEKINRGWLQKQQKNWGPRKRISEKQKQDAEAQLKSLEPEKENLEDEFRLDSTEKLAKGQIIRMQMELALQQINKADKLLEMLELAETWAQNLTDVFDQLDSGARLGLEMFLEIDGEEIVVLCTDPGLSNN